MKKADRSTWEVNLHPTQRLLTPYTDTPTRSDLNVADGELEFLQVLLQVAVLLGHLLILGLPLIALRLQCLHLALVVASLDVGLAEPVSPIC